MNGPLLVILPHNPGDVVMALLAVARIRAAFPGLAVDYVVGEECRELAEGNPLIRRAHPLPRRRLRDSWEAGDAGSVLAALEGFLDGLDAGGYAFSLNLFQERYGGILQGLVPADRKAGLELMEGRLFAVRSRYLEHLFAVPAARRDNGWHAVDLYVRAARELLDPGNRLSWPLPGSGTPCLPELRPPEGWEGGEGYLAFHPGSAWPGKRWPEAHWAALAEACVRAGHDVVLTGAPEERPVVDRVLTALSSLPAAARARVHDWSGRTTLLGAAWIYSRARMAVAGDTVAMHLAAACGTPTLALFGPSNPVETGPYGRGHFVLQTSLELPSTLDLGSPHAGLEALSAVQVAAFLLEGSAPPGVPCWETARDPDRDCQILRGPDGGRHPHQRRAAPLMDLLDGRTVPRAGTGDGGHPDPGGGRAKVRDALRRCLARDAYPSDLLGLESAERDLAAATGDSVVWEAYRIAVNGLSLKDIRRHLELRRERFEAALREEESLGAPAPS